MSWPWKPEEIQKLNELLDQNKTRTEIAEALNRTPTAIQVKVNRIGRVIYNTSDNTGNRGPTWRKEDDELLGELWTDPTISRVVMCKRLHRSQFSIRKRALQLNLGGRDYDTSYLSIPDICREMQVSHDRVSNWFRRGGLKRRKSKSGKVRYLVDSDDLLKFLESRPDLYDASKISPYLFAEEPEWLKQKRIQDRKFYPSNLHAEYTNAEDKKLQHLFNQGKSDEEIAIELHRTTKSIADRRRILCLIRTTWSDDEVEILRKYSRYKTLEELMHLLPRRPLKGIRYMCEKLKLPYHYKKECCEVLED